MNNNKDAQSNEDRTHALDRKRFAVETVTLFFLFLYVSVATFQLRAMLESNRISHAALVSVQRAFVTFKGVTGTRNTRQGEQPNWLFEGIVENAGNTRADEAVKAFAVAVLPNEPTNDKFSVDPTIGLIETTIDAKQVAGLGRSLRPENFDVFLASVGDLKRLPLPTLQVNSHLFFWGWVVYKDIFFPQSKVHLMEFCQFLSSASYVPAIDSWNIGFSTCKEHNCADEQCKDYTAVTEFAAKHKP